MIDIESFKVFLEQNVRRFFIILWPPLGEKNMLDVDMSVGFDLENKDGSIVTIGIDKDDNWTPLISNIEVTNELEWKCFESRLGDWMNGRLNELMCHEFYDASCDPLFSSIASSEVLAIEFITLKDKFDPFGVKLVFAEDYIALFPNSDGSTFETSKFNQLGNLENYKKMGEIEYVKLLVNL